MPHIPLTFSGTGRDRGHAMRAEPAALAQMLTAALVLPIWRGQPLCKEEALVWLPWTHPIFAAAPEPVFLGYLNGEPVFSADISGWRPEDGIPMAEVFDAGRQAHPLAPTGSSLTELRQVMAQLSPDEAELAATARALSEWHRRNGFCPACGGPTLFSGGGWRRDCPACNLQHFPRTDPVVIMLVLDGNSTLLGRSPGWPEGMYSTLAGFIEPGETVEAAVRREVDEETGIRCGEVRYLASQPWPFPASLMLGCVTQALSREITLDPVELEDALWVTREEMVEVFAGSHPRIQPPRQGAIARHLLENWLADRLD